MSDSILLSTKKLLGLDATYTPFDQEILIHINSVLSTLNQLGLGPDSGFRVEDATETWTDFLGAEPRYNLAKSYMYLRVRMLFDPPSIGYVITAMEKEILAMEWRLNATREDLVHPTTKMADTHKFSTTAVRLDVKAGLPFSRRLRITNGKQIWANLPDFEARMQIREEELSSSALKYDFTPHLIKAFDVNDIIIEWALTGEDTRKLKAGYFDLIVSDVGNVDARAIQVLHGYLNLIQLTTTPE